MPLRTKLTELLGIEHPIIQARATPSAVLAGCGTRAYPHRKARGPQRSETWYFLTSTCLLITGWNAVRWVCGDGGCRLERGRAWYPYRPHAANARGASCRDQAMHVIASLCSSQRLPILKRFGTDRADGKKCLLTRVLDPRRAGRTLTSKPFGVNLTILPALIPADYDAFAKVIAEERVTMVEVAGGSPRKYMANATRAVRRPPRL